MHKGERHLDISLFPIIAVDTDTQVACIARDITIKKTLEEQLRHTQRLESIGQLAGGIAHDFNNILSVIGGYAFLLEDEAGGDGCDMTSIRGITAAVERASALTRGLLAFSRKQDMEPSHEELNTVVLGAKNFISRLISEEIIFSVHQAAEPLPVFVDSWEIQQILVNLATNARDAMPHGGTLDVELSQASIDSDFIEANGFGVPGNYAVMMVSDSGCGMNEETCSKIFDPFYTTKDVGKGTGLGLAIVYGIIKQHRGFVTVRSTPGSGTSFTVYVPLSQRDNHTHTVTYGERSDNEAGLDGTESILVVDDDDTIRQLLVTILGKRGYTVISAVDGEHALSLFRVHSDTIRLVISDIIMPKMNGVEMVEQMRAHKPDTRVLFTSGYTKAVLQEKWRVGEEWDLVMKPLHVLNLLKRVREKLDSQASV